MTERTPWWKAFLPKKKSTQPISPDLDPWAPRPEKTREPSKAEPAVTPSVDSDDRYDDSYMESLFNERTRRRDMKVSRSGRFKVKGTVRQSLPIQDKDSGAKDSGAKEEVR